MMMRLPFIVGVVLIYVKSCISMKHRYIPISNISMTGLKDERDGRLFDFTTKNNKITIELGFTIPFIDIPVGRVDDKKPLVNVNVGAITAGTILSTAALIFIPKLFSGLEPQISFGRSEDGSSASSFLSRMDRTLRDHNIDSVSCTQRAICWFIKDAANKVISGSAGSMDKIVDGIASNSILEGYIQGTAIQEAIANGKQDKDCSVVYSQCPITQDALVRFARNFMTAFTYTVSKGTAYISHIPSDKVWHQ